MTRALMIWCILAAFVVGCERRAETPSVATLLSGDEPDHETWSADLILTSEGLPRLEMKAAYMASYDRTDSTFVVLSALDDSSTARVRAIVYDEAGDTTAVVLSDRIYWYEDDDRMVAEGNVRVRARNGRRIESEHLEWHDADKTLSTPGFARVYREANVLEGYGLRADEALGDVSMARITGQVEVSDE